MHGSGHGGKESSAQSAMIAGFFDLLITFSALVAAQSSVLLADFFKTLLEFVAVLLSWLAVRRINRGADHRYQYGVGKLENLSSMLVGLLMLICVMIIVTNAFHSIHNPTHIAGIGVWISIVAQIVYAVVNGFLFWRSRRAAAAESSPIMASQARLLLGRAVANVFILAALLLSKLLHPYEWSLLIDPISSLAIALFLVLSASGIFSSSFGDLLDCTLQEEHQMVILRELARCYDQYEALHGIRSRRSGSHVFIEIFLEFAPDRKVGEVQAVIDTLRKALEREIAGSHVLVAMTTEPATQA